MDMMRIPPCLLVLQSILQDNVVAHGSSFAAYSFKGSFGSSGRRALGGRGCYFDFFFCRIRIQKFDRSVFISITRQIKYVPGGHTNPS